MVSHDNSNARTRRRRRGSNLLAAATLLAALHSPAAAAVLDLGGKAVDPLGDTNGRAVVLIFARTDCPISNRYAPEVRRLYAEFAQKGVEFYLVFPDRDESAATIRGHLDEYDYPLEALRDVEHDLVERTGASITPEVAVFTPGGEMVYRGRIDNRYVDFGRARAKATRHDLQLALDAVLEGQVVDNSRTRAVGCFIADLK